MRHWSARPTRHGQGSVEPQKSSPVPSVAPTGSRKRTSFRVLNPLGVSHTRSHKASPTAPVVSVTALRDQTEKP